MLTSLFYKINFVTLIFTLNTIALFTSNYYGIHLVTIIYFLYFSFKMFNMKIYKKYMNTRLLIIISLLFMNIIIVTLINVTNVDDFKRWIFVLIAILNLLIGIQSSVLFNNKYIRNGLIQINNIMMIINIYGIIEFIVKENYFVQFIMNEYRSNLHVWSFKTELYRNFTVFSHPIIYANILIIVFWINKFLCKNKFLRYFNYILIIVNIYATKSRSSWISFALTITIYIIYLLYKANKIGKIKSKNILMITFTSVILVILYKPIVEPLSNEIIQRFCELLTPSGNVSSSQRLGAISYVLSEIMNGNILGLLFGHGFRSIQSLMAQTMISIQGFLVADNQYITVIWEYGIIGLICSISIIIYSISIIFKDNEDTSVLLALILISIHINMFFYEIDGWLLISNIYLFILGSICVKYKLE